MLTDIITAKQIDSKKRRLIRENKDHLLKSLNNYKKYADEASSRHSYKLEFEEDQEYDKQNNLNINSNPEEIRRVEERIEKEIALGSKHILESLIWGTNNLQIGNVNSDYICMLAGKIEPKLFRGRPAKYRGPNENVRILGAQHLPPRYENINKELNLFFEELNGLLIKSQKDQTKEKYSTAVETAAYAHLHLARIHPFIDGNGRTSRVLQNSILGYFGFPPITIYSEEKVEYLRHLGEAIHGHWLRRGNNQINSISEGEKGFYNYLAVKVNIYMGKILDEEKVEIKKIERQHESKF